MKRILYLFLICFTIFPALSQGLLRDTETENYLKNLTNPVFNIAGLSENQTSINLLASPEINAFVAGGQNVFVFSGLIINMNNEDELRGVLAHETAHIALGHLARLKRQIKMVSYQAMIGMAVGAAAMATAKNGGGEIGTALLIGSQDMALSSLMAYTRGEEEMADENAVLYLNKLNKTSLGLKSFLEKMQKEQMFSPDRNPYMLTHPTTPERIVHLDSSLKKGTFIKKYSDNTDFMRIKFKLSGYILSSVDYDKLKNTTSDFNFNYGKIVNLMKLNRLDEAINLCNDLLKIKKNDPFIFEFLGEIYFNKANFKESIKYYQMAYNLTKSPLILTDLAKSQIEQKLLDEAVANLKIAVFKDKSNLSAFKLLSNAYGKMNKMGESNFYLAEFYFKAGNKKMARKMLDKAFKNLNKDNKIYLKAEDLMLELKNLK